MNRGAFLDLYEFLVRISYEDLPERIVELAKLCLMDTIGIMVGATGVDIGKRLVALHNVLGDSGGSASVMGTKKKVSMTHAAFINGSLAEVLEMQDGIRYGGVHPSSTVIPAVLALAQQRQVSGKDVILSIFAGYEFLGRMTKLIYPQPFWRGFNMTGVCGAFGAAVGCSKLLNFNGGQMANAVGISGMYSPISSRESFYYDIKPTHAGRASEAGLLSALIAERGIQASGQVLETQGQGGVCTHMIAQCHDFAQVTQALGSHFELEEVYFKPYPSCRHTHGTVQAILELQDEHPIRSADVTKVNVSTYDVAKNAAGDRRPSLESAYCIRQFSIPYLVSAAMINGKFGVDEIFGSPSQDVRLYEFMPNVEVNEDIEITRRYPDATPSSVEIVLSDERRLLKLIELPKGDPRNPMSKEELAGKFRNLVVPRIGEREAEMLLSDLSNLEGLSDISNLLSRISAMSEYE